MECEICHKDYKNIKAHKRLAHPVVGRDIEQEPLVIELRGKVKEYEFLTSALSSEIESLKRASGKSVEDIARILYEDVVKPLCSERGISVGEWEGIDHNDYLTVARKIKG